VLKDPKHILRQFWGHSNFRGSQEAIITNVLNDKDVLALLPTGGGKSLCYQIPALVKEGICIVVSPLIALINNQVSSLQAKGIKAVAITGGIPFAELSILLDNCIYGNYKFLYLSPERLQQELVRERIMQMNVNLIAIDEAHCISQWGNNFRPAYRNCAILRELFPDVSIIALTATATKKVATDIIDNLHFKNEITIKDSFSRDNIIYKVIQAEDKDYKLIQLFKKSSQSGIVYVRSRRLAEQLSLKMNKSGLSVDYFHGGNTKKEKAQKLDNWMESKTKIIVATNAFGMGIDKPDVRLVVHYQVPDSIENYYQEAGRAGRDGNAATAILLLHPEDSTIAERQFLDIMPSTDFLKLLYRKLNNYFQIPYGEGSQQDFKLNFNSFCNTYKLNTKLTYNGLKTLDQYAVVSMSENFSKQASIQFITNKQQLQKYMDDNMGIFPIIQTILRTYGGIFEYETKINTLLLSKKINISEEQILKALEQLNTDNIIEYNAQHNDIELIFLVPREDDKTINSFAKSVKNLQSQRVSRLKSMLAYINTSDKCRNLKLLSYFGEKKEKCEKCDVCTSDNKLDEKALHQIAIEVKGKLKLGAISSRNLIASLPYSETNIIEALQLLLEDNKIEINNQNQYQLKNI